MLWEHGPSSLSAEQRVKYLGYDYEQMCPRDDPSRQIVAAHGLGYMRHLNGISLLLVATPVLMYYMMRKRTNPDPRRWSAWLAWVISVGMVSQAFLGFMGDYWCGENDVVNPLYHYAFNVVDNIHVHILVSIQVVAVIWHAFQTRGNRLMVGITFLIAMTAIAFKKLGAEHNRRAFWESGAQCWTNVPAAHSPLERNWTSEDYRKSFVFQSVECVKDQRMCIWWQHFFHILWHVFIPLGTCLQVYLLLEYPFDKELDEEEYERPTLDVV